ncbi:MAG: glycosyl hydrolase family 57 [Planctomycetes bacterium RBG_16_55_9]|nr:MAG: glycosyl hydrolase family 57 [Planctomycetes bacterium RBG_16_55_9]
MTELTEYVDGVPNLCGSEKILAKAVNHEKEFWQQSPIDWGNVKSTYAIALHMHQPIIPNPDQPLRQAEEISNLKYMMDHPHIGDNHNAPVFRNCYKRMGEFIPALTAAGKEPRVMLDYSGTLLHGMRKMGLDDVFDKLQRITCDPEYRRCVEWLGSGWGHPVAPSTPIQDYRLHVSAWRHFFAALFGIDALSRIRGFSPSEMALPNHPDVFYEFVRTLKDAGYRWVIVQEHTVEHVENGRKLDYPHRPHRLIAKNSEGRKLTITAIVKTQGSDTKLIGQMQPYYEARGLARIELGGKAVPSLVTQISDGENGGVMMNEFPGKYHEAMSESSGTPTPPVNVTEYLEYLDSLGVNEDSFPAIQPIMQHRIWEEFTDGAGPDALAEVIKQLEQQQSGFHVEGGSWTNNISWVKGYEKVLKPMEQVSAEFSEKVLAKGIDPSEPRFRKALYHLLLTQTSCYRYWGEGEWVSYGRELCRRTAEILKHDF